MKISLWVNSNIDEWIQVDHGRSTQVTSESTRSRLREPGIHSRCFISIDWAVNCQLSHRRLPSKNPKSAIISKWSYKVSMCKYITWCTFWCQVAVKWFVNVMVHSHVMLWLSHMAKSIFSFSSILFLDMQESSSKRDVREACTNR